MVGNPQSSNVMEDGAKKKKKIIPHFESCKKKIFFYSCVLTLKRWATHEISLKLSKKMNQPVIHMIKNYSGKKKTNQLTKQLKSAMREQNKKKKKNR